MIPRRHFVFYPGEAGDIVRCLLRPGRPRGDAVRRFEQAFARYIGSPHAVATCTGRQGLQLILEALELRPGSEIIIPAYTLGDLARMLKQLGYTPVAADVRGDTFHLDPEQVARRITARTGAILATHLFGAPCDLHPIIEVARRHKLRVIEDCAHAAGATYRGSRVGSLGDAAFFSFEVIKPISTFGGGMIVTHDDGLADRVRQAVSAYRVSPGAVLKKVILGYAEQVFLASPFFGPVVSTLSDPRTQSLVNRVYWLVHQGTRTQETRFIDLQAMLGLKQLPRLDARNKCNQERTSRLSELLQDHVCVQRLLPGAGSTHYFFVVLLPCQALPVRRRLLRYGVDAGVGAEITDDCAALLGQRDCPIAADISERAIQLPAHDALRPDQLTHVARSVIAALGRESGDAPLRRRTK